MIDIFIDKILQCQTLVISLTYQLKQMNMEITHLTLTDNSRVEVISRTKDMFNVSYGKDTKGNEVIGLVHRSIILLFA